MFNETKQILEGSDIRDTLAETTTSANIAGKVDYNLYPLIISTFDKDIEAFEKELAKIKGLRYEKGMRGQFHIKLGSDKDKEALIKVLDRFGLSLG